VTESASARREHSALIAALDARKPEARLAIGDHAFVATHLDREYWPAHGAQPAITKRDYVRYLIRASPWMLPHLRDRPLTLFRWPEGIARRRVLDKHWTMTLPPFVERVDVFSESKGRPDQYLLCNNLATLLWLANMGTLEFHVWHSRVTANGAAADAGTGFATSVAALRASALERPDYVLFDVDPFIYAGNEPKGAEPAFNRPAFTKATAVARWLRVILERLGLSALVKTSGKTGLHVIVPIARTLRYDAVREIARVIGAHVLREHPADVTLDWAVTRRTDKVFVDANMNVRGKSMTAPYSPRGLPGAPVSMPVDWRRLPTIDPTQFRMPAVEALVTKGRDPWSGWLERKQDVAQALQSLHVT
jgi:bifunctional non-homologous end joining protein LigD